jgi:hypothetical protein
MNSIDPDRFSDLEWMLSSSREDEQAVIKFLVLDQYLQVLTLCQAMLQDQLAARQAAAQTLAAAVVQSDQYSGSPSAPTWIYRLAVDCCRRQEKTKTPLHCLVWLLRQEFDLPSREIAYVLETSEGKVLAELAISRKTSNADEQSGGLPEKPPTLPASFTGGSGNSKSVEDQVWQLVQSARQRRRFSARLQEAFLIGLGLILAVGLGRAAITGFTSPASPVTPTSAVITTQEMLVYPEGQPQAGAPVERRIMYPAEAGDTLTTISEKVGIRLDRLLELNKLPPEKPLQPGQPVVIALATPALSLITPTPVTPVPPLEPLTLNSSPNTIRQRILDSHHSWNTLWAAADTIFYGPAGYVGPPRVERQQVWISQPDYSLTLSGKPDGEVEIAIQASAGLITGLDSRTGTRTRLNRGILVDYSQPIHELLLPTRMRTPFRGIIEVGAEEIISGRPTLLVDLREVDLNSINSLDLEPIITGRFWVDRVTGVILRRQWFDPHHPDLITKEVVVTRIRYDLPLSNRFFDPTQPLPTRLFWYAISGEQDQGFASQPFDPVIQPERAPIPQRTPPAGHDLARSSLQYQWTSLADLDPSQPTRADVFADGYYLGEVLFGDPRSLSCLRSPDGKRIAFTEWFEEPPFGARPLRWFSLESLHTVYEPLPDLLSGSFAFSPDSRRLALFACERSPQSCGIYLLDLETGHYRQLAEMAYAGILGWRPDGEQLAFRGAKKPRDESSLWVIDADSGEFVYHGPLVPESGQPAGRSPLPGWGPVLQRTGRGVESCSQPPGD